MLEWSVDRSPAYNCWKIWELTVKPNCRILKKFGKARINSRKFLRDTNYIGASYGKPCESLGCKALDLTLEMPGWKLGGTQWYCIFYQIFASDLGLQLALSIKHSGERNDFNNYRNPE
jgi:hypothetical protein